MANNQKKQSPKLKRFIAQNNINDMIGTICIVHDQKIIYLAGMDDDESDYYYAGYPIGSANIEYYSAVGNCMSLKGLIPDYDYNRMQDISNYGRGITKK